jgi:hypothetical protein
MSSPVYGGASNDELDWLVWHFLRDRDGQATNDAALVAAAGGQSHLIKARMQAMRQAGRIRFWRHPLADPSIKAHGWEVLGCPGAGIQEDGQFDWAYGCADCQCRTRPDPADGVIEPPAVIAFECELRIEPSA